MPFRFRKNGRKSGRPKGERIDLNKLVNQTKKKSQKSEANSPTSPTEACPLSDQYSHDILYWDGVKLNCVENRSIQIRLKDKRLSIDIGDYRIRGADITVEEQESHVLELPESFNEKIVGKCICIASRGAQLIVQFQTPSTSAYSRLMYIDLNRKHIQLFEDAAKYFHWNFINQGPIECYINANMKFALFLLPSSIKSNRKWSRLLCSRIKCQDVGYNMGNVEEYGMDRRNQAVAIYPNGEEILFVLVDSYCSFCHMRTQEFESKIASEVKINLKHTSKAAVETDSDSEKDDEYDSDVVYDHLVQCSVAFCRSGEIIVLVCLVQNICNDVCVYKLNIYQICSVQRCVLQSHTLHVPRSLVSHVSQVDLVTSFISSCDSYFNVLFLTVFNSPICYPKKIRFLKENSLKNLCRAVVLNHIQHNSHISKLNLPAALTRFLTFQ